MAKQRRSRDFLDLSISKEKVRYGRATITIESWAMVSLTPVAQVLADYQRDECTAEEVAWVFIRSQAAATSPTFDWKKADLDVLLPRVTAVISQPDLEAQTPDELARELEELQEREQARKAKTKALATRWSQFISKSATGAMFSQLEKTQPTFKDSIFRTYTSQLGERLSGEIAAAAGGPKFYIDPNVWQSLSLATGVAAKSETISSKLIESVMAAMGRGDLTVLSHDFSEMAREAKVVRAADAVDATAKAVEKTSDVDELVAGLQPMFEKLEAAIGESKDSVSKTIFVAVAISLIVLTIESSLIRLGIPLGPVQPAVKIEPEKSPKAPTKKTKKKTKAAKGKAKAKK